MTRTKEEILDEIKKLREELKSLEAPARFVFEKGTLVRYRTYTSPDDSPMDLYGTVRGHGNKWVTITNKVTGKEDWAKANPLCAQAIDAFPADLPLQPESHIKSVEPSEQTRQNADAAQQPTSPAGVEPKKQRKGTKKAAA